LTKRVIISGASGFTGRAAVEDFISNGWEVIPLVRKPCGLPNECIIDLIEENCFDKLSLLPKSEVIIHLASKVDFSSNASPSCFLPTSSVLTSYLSQLAKKWSSHLIFTSGIIVYGNIEYIDNFSLPKPNNEYGKAKLIAENIIKSEDISHTILRIAGIYGYNGPNHLGLNKAITSSIDNAVVPILKGNGSAKRNYIFVNDLVKVIRLCAEEKIQGTHLLGGSEAISIRKMLEAICETILDGAKLTLEKGGESKSIVVKTSNVFPKCQSFIHSLNEIKSKYA